MKRIFAWMFVIIVGLLTIVSAGLLVARASEDSLLLDPLLAVRGGGHTSKRTLRVAGIDYTIDYRAGGSQKGRRFNVSVLHGDKTLWISPPIPERAGFAFASDVNSDGILDIVSIGWGAYADSARAFSLVGMREVAIPDRIRNGVAARSAKVIARYGDPVSLALLAGWGLCACMVFMKSFARNGQ
jgi:hypothetical protein